MRREPKPVNERDEIAALREENEQLRALVVELSRTVVKQLGAMT